MAPQGKGPAANQKDFPPLLYNLSEDIGEANDVAAKHPEIVAKLQAYITANRADLGDEGIAPGCRELGRAADPKPLLPAP